MKSDISIYAHLSYMHKLMEKIVNNLEQARNSLYKFKLTDSAFIIFSNMLGMANVTYIELLRYEQENDLQSGYSLDFMNELELAFNIFTNILSEKDIDGLSDLDGIVNSLESKWKELNEYITERLTEQIS